jgi:hypothetical protein
MSHTWNDPMIELAASTSTRVELDEEGVLHVIAGSVTLRLDRDTCEELATTLARAVVALGRRAPRQRKPRLSLVSGAAARKTDPSAS